MKVSEILKNKPAGVKTIGSGRTIYDAVRVLVEENIGSLLVTDAEGGLAGIITERDILRQCARRFGALDETKIEEVMTRKLLIGAPEDDIEYVQAIMTKNRIRHLPIISAGKLVGLVSIGDVVKALHSRTEAENRDLKEFISVSYVC